MVVDGVTSFLFLNMPWEYYSDHQGGAVSTVIHETAKSLVATGHSATLVSRSDDTLEFAGELLGLGAIAFPPKPVRAVHRLFPRQSRIDPVFRRYRADVSAALDRRDGPAPEVVVQCNDYSNTDWLRDRFPRARFVTWLHNDVPISPLDVPMSIDRVVCVSEYIRSAAIRRGIPAEKTFVVNNGVDTSIFHPREAWPVSAERPRALCIGRLDPNKGHDAAIASIARLRQTVAVDVTLAGARWWYGPQLDDYGKGLLDALSAVDGRFVGLVPRAEVPALMREHDVVFALSRSQEPFSLVGLEAMASGCALIASARGGFPEMCDNAAIYVDPDSEVMLDRALNELLSDASRLADRKRAARQRAEQLPWSLTAERLLSACQ